MMPVLVLVNPCKISATFDDGLILQYILEASSSVLVHHDSSFHNIYIFIIHVLYQLFANKVYNTIHLWSTWGMR